MFSVAAGFARACWQILAEASPYVLFGFFAAGLLKALLPQDAVARHLGRRSVGAVLKASLLGIPLPLCSCGVIPAAIALRRQGANRGASAAFLVSTPESGIDSIAITWALLDPIMTVVRPLAAFLTATVTGLLINALPEEPTPSTMADASGCTDECASDVAPDAPLGRRLRAGLDYAFGDLLGDIGRWLLLGVAVAALITTLVPVDAFALLHKREALSLLVMLVVGIPLYICASASTPIAAALVLKGISPGAALVFLLAGPATNAATVTVFLRYWGRRATAVYLATIACCSLALGWLVDRLYAATGADISHWVSRPGAAGHPWGTLSAIILLALILKAAWPKRPDAKDT
jgi:uncharacterized membrane protein YraQ (UPF0718 family)